MPAATDPALAALESSMREYRVTGMVSAPGGVPRAATLSVWALGATLALILAERQFAALQLTIHGHLSWRSA